MPATQLQICFGLFAEALRSQNNLHSRSSRCLAEKQDGAQIDVDIVTHLIALFQASQREKQERLASIAAEVSQAQVWLWSLPL